MAPRFCSMTPRSGVFKLIDKIRNIQFHKENEIHKIITWDVYTGLPVNLK